MSHLAIFIPNAILNTLPLKGASETVEHIRDVFVRASPSLRMDGWG